MRSAWHIRCPSWWIPPDTGVVPDDQLAEAVGKVFDFRPAAIIDQLGLRRPQYRRLAAYGHIGREDLGVSWEKTDKAQALKAYFA